MMAQWTGVAVGVWLMAAPAVIGYVDEPAGDVHRTLGPLAVSFAIIAVWGATRGVRWSNLGVAAALLVAPLVTGHPGAAGANGLACGLLLAATTPFAGAAGDPLGGGWRGLRSRSSSAPTP